MFLTHTLLLVNFYVNVGVLKLNAIFYPHNTQQMINDCRTVIFQLKTPNKRMMGSG